MPPHKKYDRRQFLRDSSLLVGGLCATAPFAAFAQNPLWQNTPGAFTAGYYGTGYSYYGAGYFIGTYYGFGYLGQAPQNLGPNGQPYANRPQPQQLPQQPPAQGPGQQSPSQSLPMGPQGPQGGSGPIQTQPTF